MDFVLWLIAILVFTVFGAETVCGCAPGKYTVLYSMTVQLYSLPLRWCGATPVGGVGTLGAEVGWGRVGVGSRAQGWSGDWEWLQISVRFN